MNRLEAWRRIDAARRDLYASVATHTVDTSRRPITGIADELASRIASGPPALPVTTPLDTKESR